MPVGSESEVATIPSRSAREGGAGCAVDIIIVTYRRPLALARCVDSAVWVGTRFTEDSLGRAVQIWVVDNGNSDDVAKLVHQRASQLPAGSGVTLSYVPSPANLGVAGGRNLGFSCGTAPYAVFLDDDAVFSSADCLDNVVETFERYPTCVAQAFRCLLPDGTESRTEMPYQARASLIPVHCFMGVGHAIARARLPEAVLYPPLLPYGHEEWYACLRIHDAGGAVLFNPLVCVTHFREVSGRHAQKNLYMARNKVRIAILTLPWPFVLTHVVAWCGWLVLRGQARHLVSFLSGCAADYRVLRRQARIIRLRTVIRIFRLGGTVLF